MLVHEGIHGMIGVVIIDEEACDDEIDFGKVKFFVTAGQ